MIEVDYQYHMSQTQQLHISLNNGLDKIRQFLHKPYTGDLGALENVLTKKKASIKDELYKLSGILFLNKNQSGVVNIFNDHSVIKIINHPNEIIQKELNKSESQTIVEVCSFIDLYSDLLARYEIASLETIFIKLTSKRKDNKKSVSAAEIEKAQVAQNNAIYRYRLESSKTDMFKIFTGERK